MGLAAQNLKKIFQQVPGPGKTWRDPYRFFLEHRDWDSKFNGQYFGDLVGYSLMPLGSLPGSYEGPWSHLVLLAQPQMKNFVIQGQDVKNLRGLLKLEKRSLIGSPLQSDQLDLSGGIHFVEHAPDTFENLKFAVRGANFQKVLGFMHVTPEQSWHVDGDLFAEGALSGNLNLPNGSGSAQIQNWRFNQAKQRGKLVTAHWACAKGDFYIQDAELTAITPKEVIRADATIDSLGFSDLSLQGDHARLSDWSSIVDAYFPLQAFVNFKLDYQRDLPSLKSQFTLTETSYEGSVYKDSKFDLNWAKNQLTLHGQLLGEAMIVDVKATETSTQREFTLLSKMKEANLAAFLPGFASSQMELLVTGDAELRGTQPRSSKRNLLTGLLTEKLRLNGKIDVDEGILKRALQVLQQFKPFRVEIDSQPNGNVRFTSRLIEIESSGRSLKMGGYFEETHNFRLDIVGGTELRALAALAPVVSRSEGSIDIRGRWEPQGFTGSIDVTSGLLTFQDSPLVIRDVEATLRATNSDFQLQRFSGQFREGSMTGSGFFKLREEGIVSANLGLRFDHILLQPLDGVNFRASGPIDLKVENGAGEVRGKLFITDGLFRRRVDLRSDLANFFKEERRSFKPRDYEKAPWRQWKMNVGIQTTEPFIVRNNLGEGAANFNLAVRGTAGRPYLEGSVDIIRGQYTFNQKEFVIRSGSVLFRNGESNIPNYDIRSETEIGDYRVATRLQGGPGFQKIQYSSEPPLSEKDILSLIQFGLPASAEEFKGQDAQRSLSFSGLSFVTGGIQDKIETRLSKDLGIQRFQLTPSFFEETGRTELQLTLGADLVKNRLAINYSNYLSAAGGHRLELDFKVNRNVSLIGSWRDVRLEQGKTGQSEDDFGADIRFRFEIE